MLKELHLKGVGTSPHFDVELGERINIFTGDNGLGKTFLLDISWWLLTGTWTEYQAFPNINNNYTESSEISCHIFDKQLNKSRIVKRYFDYDQFQWKNITISPSLSSLVIPSLSSLVIYIRVDGNFSVFDPNRNLTQAYHFNNHTLWHGLKSNDEQVLCNGLIQDWVYWQNQPEPKKFQLLSHVIRKLSPHPNEWMEPGEPTRVSLEDVRDIPTIKMPYSTIPIIHASAGMKRILGLAYLLVWSWYEHQKASQMRRREPVKNIILLMDEVESHLHPQWSRSILPSILEVVRGLQESMNLQVLSTTHSPLVIASIEPLFNAEQDKLFLFHLQEQFVSLDEIPWSKQRDMVGWVTSDIFGLNAILSL